MYNLRIILIFESIQLINVNFTINLSSLILIELRLLGWRKIILELFSLYNAQIIAINESWVKLA